MSEACCRSSGHDGGHSGDPNRPWWLQHLAYIRIAAVAMAIACVWGNVFGAGAERVLGLMAVAFCGYPIFREALEASFQKRMTMELSMTIALVAALAIGENLTALVIVLFVLVAEDLEKRTIDGGRRSISKLLSLLPQTALIKRGEQQFEEVSLAEVSIGDIVLVKPGSRVVVDGMVVAGNSFVDESAVTGEAVAAEKLPGYSVYAGTINQAGSLEVEAERVGSDTTFGRIIHAVEESSRTRATVQKLADRIAGYLVVFALSAAALTYALTGDIHHTISVILVAGACGVAAGTPLAVLGSIAYAARRGSIIKGGLYLEKLGSIDTVVFDKTGTLTFGAPEVVAVLPADGTTTADVVQTAATAERVSEHPLAKAILARSVQLNLVPSVTTEFDYVPGRGIVCRSEAGQSISVGNQALLKDLKIRGLPPGPVRRDVSEVLVARDGEFVGRIQISDRVRPEARQVVQDLQAMGIRTVMLTGDAEPVAKAVAAQLGIQEVAAELRPEDKCNYVKQLKARGCKVAVVGDGINDAPALVEAEVGIAVGSGSAIALESADVVLISNNLQRLVDTLNTARRCRRVIYFNLVGTIVVDAVGMLCAGFGLLNPMLAALVHVGSELAFMANSARLFPMFSFGRRSRFNESSDKTTVKTDAKSKGQPSTGEASKTSSEGTKDLGSPEAMKDLGSPEGAKDAGSSEGIKDLSSPEGTKDLGSPEGTKDAGSPEGTKDLGSPEATKDLSSPEGAKDLGSPEGIKDLSSSEGTKDLGSPEGTKGLSSPEGTKDAGAPDGAKSLSSPEGIKDAGLPDGTRALSSSEGTEDAGSPEGTNLSSPDGTKDLSSHERAEDLISSEGTEDDVAGTECTESHLRVPCRACEFADSRAGVCGLCGDGCH
jgi:heavy metal translocating P-type ATPase